MLTPGGAGSLIRTVKPQPTMQLVIAIFAACAVISVALSTLISRHCLSRHRKPSFLIPFVITLLTLVLMILAVFQGEVFLWRHWIDGGSKGFPLWFAVPLYGAFMLPFVAGPAVGVVVFYRRRFQGGQNAV
jgi:hypothetical protein